MLRNHMAIFIMYSYCCWLQEGKLATGILTPLVKNAGFGNVSDFLDKGTDDIAKVLQWKSPDAAEAVRPRCVWKCLCACNVCVCVHLKLDFPKLENSFPREERVWSLWMLCVCVHVSVVRVLCVEKQVSMCKIFYLWILVALLECCKAEQFSPTRAIPCTCSKAPKG